MKLEAKTSYQASIEILHYVWHIDYKYTTVTLTRTPFVFVYFDPNRCKFEIYKQQKLDTKYLIKRYTILDESDITGFVATKYPFYKILIGATSMRRLLSYREFFEIVRENPEWV